MPARLKILLVDDNETDLFLAREAFSSHEKDALVTTYNSGADALDHLRNEQNELPDVIITDLNMPGINGLELIRLLKDEPKLRLIPVVVLSTSDQREDIQQAYSLHASSYLVKAHDFNSFVRQIDSFLGFWSEVKIAR